MIWAQRKTIDDKIDGIAARAPANRLADKVSVKPYAEVLSKVLRYNPIEDISYDPDDTTSRQRISSDRNYLRGKDTNRLSAEFIFIPTEQRERTAEFTYIEIKRQEVEHRESNYESSEHEADPLPQSEEIRVYQEINTEAVFRSGRQTHPDTKEAVINYLRADTTSKVRLKLAECFGVRTRDYSIDPVSLN